MKQKITMGTVLRHMEANYYLYCIDACENLNDAHSLFDECLQKRSCEPLDEYITNTLTEREFAAVDEVFYGLQQQIADETGDEEAAERFFEQHIDQIRDTIYERNRSTPVQDLLRNTADIPVRVELHTQYDGITPVMAGTQDGYSYKGSYLKDILQALNLNPRTVKQLLNDNGVKTRGRFPDLTARNGKELVSYEQFLEELKEIHYGENLLVFTCTVKASDLYETGFRMVQLTILKENKCGLFSPDQGAGSLIGMELLSQVTLDLRKGDHSHYRLVIDSANRYSITETFGVDRNFFGSAASVTADIAA